MAFCCSSFAEEADWEVSLEDTCEEAASTDVVEDEDSSDDTGLEGACEEEEGELGV